MRGECQARLLLCDNGDIEPLVSPLAIEVVSDADKAFVAPMCGKPAVESYSALSIKDGKFVDNTITLCAEHWDYYQSLMKGD